MRYIQGNWVKVHTMRQILSLSVGIKGVVEPVPTNVLGVPDTPHRTACHQITELFIGYLVGQGGKHYFFLVKLNILQYYYHAPCVFQLYTSWYEGRSFNG